MKWYVVVLIVLFCMPSVVRAGSNLKVGTSKHYEVILDLSNELARDCAMRLDAMYEEYARRMSDFGVPNEAKVLPVYLFQKKEDYVAFTHSEHTAGLFQPGDNSYLASFVEPQGLANMRRTLQHEAFHQFAHFVVSPNIPTWLNEGIAELYNDAIWTGNKYIMGELYPRRVRRIDDEVRRKAFVPFDEMIGMSQKKWNETLATDPEKATTYYNQAWAMMYFLTMSGRNAQPRMITAYLKRLHDKADPTETWKEMFPDTKALQNQFAAWATHAVPTPGGTLIERQEVLADIRLMAASHNVNFGNIADFRNWAVQHVSHVSYTVGASVWHSTDRPETCFRDLSNEMWNEKALYFEDAGGALPDIVCAATSDRLLRTRFFKIGGKLEHDLIFDVSSRKLTDVQMGGLKKGIGLGGLH